MNFETRLTKLEKAASEKSAAPCHCGAGPIVCWPNDRDGEPATPGSVETTCPQCGGERAVLAIHYGD